jgi:hypothetical protein
MDYKDIFNIVDNFAGWFVGDVLSHGERRKHLLVARIVSGRIERKPSALECVILMFELAAIYPHDLVISLLQDEFMEIPVKNKGLILGVMKHLNLIEDYQKRSFELLQLIESIELE